MKKILKWTGVALLSLIVLISITAFYFSNSFDSRLTKLYEVTPAMVQIPTDSLSMAEGKRLAMIHCAGCHGKDYGGTAFFEDPTMGSIPASNLTKGTGGKGNQYNEVDFVRAIRHGVKKDGTPAFVMPAKEFQHLSNEDLGSIVAYIQSVPPVNKSWPLPKLTFMAKTLAGSGLFGDVLNAENIDHTAITQVTAPTKAVTVEFGDYLVKIGGCRSCHGEQLNGMQPAEPGAPFAPNISPGGKLGQWSEFQFMQTLRTGTTPDNRKLNPKFMPYEGIGLMTDEELSALFKYLQSQPKLADAVKK